MHPALERLDHRPWPIPERRWILRQTWLDLLFAHWPVPAAELRPLVPPPLEVQELDGTSWIAVVPFRMEGIMLRPLPDLPYVSAFPELNVRLYVEHEGKPGVWFLSLDAANRLAVWVARRFFHLPYFHARMKVEAMGDGDLRYRSERLDEPAGLAFEAIYGPTGSPYESRPGTLEHWLTERYCFYARSPAGELYRTEVQHRPWPLQPARAEIATSELLRPHGLSVSGPPALLHFSRRIEVVAWPPERLGAEGG